MRYLPHTKKDIKSMLKAIGVKGIDELFDVIPEESLFQKPPSLPDAMTEEELLKHFKSLAAMNTTVDEVKSFVGGGVYNHYVPVLIDFIISRSEFFTAYTPYQPEISQGTLQAIFEYQTMISSLLDMNISNASMYDGATALAEGIWMTRRINTKRKILIASNIHPEYREVINTYCEPFLKDIEYIPYNSKTGIIDVDDLSKRFNDDVSAVVLQSPNFFGCIEEIDKISKIVHRTRSLLVVAFTEPLSFGLFNPPGSYGADIVVGEGQSLGMPISFGGPHLGIFTSRGQYVRSMPGRLVGKTIDKRGNHGFVLTLSTREQHIRREKATSNICSNHNLNAIIASIYLAIMGPQGLSRIARINYNLQRYLKEELSKIKGIKIKFDSLNFNEFVIQTEVDAEELITKGIEEKVIPGINIEKYFPELKNCILVTTTEKNSIEDINELVRFFKKYV